MESQNSEDTLLLQNQHTLLFIQTHSVIEKVLISIGVVTLILVIYFTVISFLGLWIIYIPILLEIILGFNIFHFRKKPIKASFILITIVEIIFFGVQVIIEVFCVLKLYEMFKRNDGSLNYGVHIWILFVIILIGIIAIIFYLIHFIIVQIEWHNLRKGSIYRH